MTLRTSRGDRLAPCVLVVDDDASIRRVVRVALAAEGWSVIEASDPADGIAKAKSELPDVVLLDVNFANDPRDGFSVCRELKSLASTKHVPVVLFTAQDDPENRAFAMAVGATAFMVKPFGPLDLVRVLRLVLQPETSDPPVGLYLIDAGVINAAQLERALAEQRLRQGKPAALGEIVVELGMATPEAVQRALGRQSRAREAPDVTDSSIEVRVVIADDNASVRTGLHDALAAEDGFSVVGVAKDGAEALREIHARRPDVVILDNDMPELSGLEVLRALHAELPRIAVVIFTLDDSVREEAIAAGATSVITKDTPLRVLIAEVRRAASSHPPVPQSTAGVVLAARTVARVAGDIVPRRKRGVATMGMLGVAYAGLFLLIEPVIGASASILALPPVAIAGALMGLEAGLVAAVLSSVLTAALWQSTGHSLGEPILTVGGNGLGVLALMGLGAGFGAMRVLRGRVNPDARRAGSLAEAAAVLAMAEGPDALRLLTLASLDVIPGDAALLFLPIPGGGSELVAATGVPAALIGSRGAGKAIARAQRIRSTTISDTTSASLGVDLPRMRTALVTTLTAPDGGTVGVLAVLATRRNAYERAHIQALSTYAGFAGMAIATRLASSAARKATETQRA